MPKSFYDLDHIIELNEKRLEQYHSEYNRVQDKYAVPIIVYSALSIHLVPMVQNIVNRDFHWVYDVLFILFGACLGASLYFFVKLLIPCIIFYRKPPQDYYTIKRLRYEKQLGFTATQQGVDLRVKGSYINELEAAIINNERMLLRKRSFYYDALILALISAIPYLGCLGFHFSKKADKIQKVELVNQKFFNFDSILFRYEKRDEKKYQQR